MNDVGDHAPDHPFQFFVEDAIGIGGVFSL
jgi:hypothetical protein